MAPRMRTLTVWLLTVAVAAAHAVAAAAPASAIVRSCPWSQTLVASGLGSLENLGFDGSGGLLLSRTTDGSGQIYRLHADGTGTTVVPDVDAPGGISVDAGTAYFTTGNSFRSGVSGRTDGTIASVNLADHTMTTVATDLTMPNGMARLPGGDFVVSRNLGLSTGLTRVAADGSASVPFSPRLDRTNGVAYDPVRNSVITSLDLSPVVTLAVVDATSGDVTQRVNLGLLGLIGFPDDLTVGGDGLVYLAMDAGAVVQLNLATRSACTVGVGMFLSTAVKFGAGPGWDTSCLYVTNLSGDVRRLCPPTS